jgi:hypothetical protein
VAGRSFRAAYHNPNGLNPIKALFADGMVINVMNSGDKTGLSANSAAGGGLAHLCGGRVKRASPDIVVLKCAPIAAR